MPYRYTEMKYTFGGEQMVRWFLAASLVVGLLWLALSPSVTERRTTMINEAIERGTLGKLPPPFDERFRDQVRWLSRHAGLDGVAVNERVDTDRLNVIACTPKFEHLTRCGPGNAIYDPALEVIFIDESLIVPYEFTVLGETGVYSMVNVESLGFVVAQLNFILAHEFGHVGRHASAAFFHYGHQPDSRTALEDELEADRFAVSTLLSAYASEDIPESLIGLSSLDQVGLAHAELSGVEAAAGEIAGAMQSMALALMFSSSPYSPYYSSESHPDFLRRATDALSAVADSGLNGVLGSHADVIHEELRRYRALASWENIEVYFPAPVYRIEVIDREIFVGCRQLPQPADLRAGVDSPPLQEWVYSAPLDAVRRSLESGRSFDRFELVASGSSSDIPGDWIDRQIDSLLIAGADSGVVDWGVRRERVFIDNGESYDGVSIAGHAWRWTAPDGTEKFMTEAAITRAADRVGLPGASIGVVQMADGKICVPLAHKTDRAFRVLSVPVDAPLVGVPEDPGLSVLESSGRIVQIPSGAFVGSDALSLDTSASFESPAGRLSVEGARRWRGAWWVPGQTEVDGRDGWAIWRITATGGVLKASEPLLSSFAGPEAAGDYRRDLDASSTLMLAPSAGPLLFGFVPDTIYSIDPNESEAHPVFHPASNRLQTRDLGSGAVLFWIVNGRKCYIVDLRGGDP